MTPLKSGKVIQRAQLGYAKERLFKGKALIIYGPRQSGKTTFAEMLMDGLDAKILRMNGDDADTREQLASANETKLRAIIGAHNLVFIDEAQRVPEIGLAIKIILDRIKGVQVIATGSSSFELAGKINEPLTGRKYEMLLLPLAWNELVAHTDFTTENRLVEQRMVYGCYPEIVTGPAMAEEHVKLIANSYLYRDLYTLEQLKKPGLLEKLVKALALQVGSEVSVNELAQLLGADNKTVEKYIQLLHQAFVVFSLGAFSRNVRNELKKSRKIYFYDNGIINAVTGNFSPVQNRSDIGALWENYLVSERIKWKSLNRQTATSHFWRTTQQQEVDYVEVGHNTLNAFEFKWSDKAKKAFPKTFVRAYPQAVCLSVSRSDFHGFLA